VISDTPSTGRTSPSDSGVLVVCAMSTTAASGISRTPRGCMNSRSGSRGLPPGPRPASAPISA
jgi:hypothetical protein